MVDSVLRYYHELRRFLLRKAEDSATAEDIVQESYARALGTMQTGTTVENPRSLLYRIARNLLADRSRQRAVSDMESLDDWLTQHEDASPTSALDQPEEKLRRKRIAAAYVTAIRTLPPRCREAFVMSVYDGLTNEAIALRMGISESMVRKHVLRAMLRCRECEGDASPTEAEPQ